MAFGELRDFMFEDYLRTILRIQVVVQEQASPQLAKAQYSGPSGDIPSMMADARAQASRNMQQVISGPQGVAMRKPVPVKAATVVKDKDDPYTTAGRNDPCPCGSGKKYKKCHGATEV
jgi:preprotein translocase subunit SecA